MHKETFFDIKNSHKIGITDDNLVGYELIV